ncbi:MAG: carbohydrate ABC transporter permease [Spirochaetales bacterium]|nr:carbohydrate ABC transporter permease [Spirochaetales bacterium]
MVGFLSKKKTAVHLLSTGRDKLFDILNGIYLLVTVVIVVYPIIYILSASFSSPGAVSRGAVVLWPVEFSLEGYKKVFQNKSILIGYMNSLIYMSVGTIINVAVTMMAAYALAQKDLPGRKIIMLAFTFTLIFSGGIIPFYLVVKNTVGVNHRITMVIPNAMSVANLIIARTFFQQSIPVELREAAKMDGCNDFRFFFRIAIPLSSAIAGVLTILYALYHWNSFFYPFIFLSSKKLQPLQIVLRNILLMNEIGVDSIQNVEYASKLAGLNDLLKFSLIVVSSVPVLLLYPLVQRYFVKGILIGSLKG